MDYLWICTWLKRFIRCFQDRLWKWMKWTLFEHATFWIVRNELLPSVEVPTNQATYFSVMTVWPKQQYLILTQCLMSRTSAPVFCGLKYFDRCVARSADDWQIFQQKCCQMIDKRFTHFKGKNCDKSQANLRYTHAPNIFHKNVENSAT